MNRDATSDVQRSAGTTWVRVGLTILFITLAGVSWLWLKNPLSTGRMFVPLLVGGVPAVICFFVALYFSVRHVRIGIPPAARWIEWRTVRHAVAGLLLFALGARILAVACDRRDREQQAKWVGEAERVVAQFLQVRKNLRPYPMRPGESPPDLGAFQELWGEGYYPPRWNIQGYRYLVAERMARFANGDLPVTLYVEEGGRTKPIAGEPAVRFSQWGTGIREGTFGQGVMIHVAHPDLQ